jgi:hypothetical protein
MLFTTRGSTDFPLRGVSFATKGVEDFLEHGLKTDEQDFIGKMEGFAIQGVKGLFFFFQSWYFFTVNVPIGAAKNHQQRVSSLRADVRSQIQEGLRESSFSLNLIINNLTLKWQVL